MAELNVTDSVWKFTLDIFHLLCNNEKTNNVFLSPLSIMSALAMTMAGARGKTAEELQASLHLKGAEKDEVAHKEMGKLLEELSLTTKKDAVTSNVANKIFVEQSFKVFDAFKKILKDFYSASHGEVDYLKNSAAAVAEINKWVETATKGKITNLVSTDSVTSATRLILVNAIHFKGQWQDPFNRALTIEQDFHVSNSEKIKVQMMQKRDASLNYNYSEETKTHCVRLPFGDGRYSMFVLVPKENFGLAALESRLTTKPEILRELIEFCIMDADIAILMIPRFQLGCKFDLENQLPKLGMKSLFDEGSCDLSGIAGEKNLVMSKVVHKAFLEVNEEGAEAAAATAAQIALMCAMPGPNEPIHVIADHPFMVVLACENRPLFIGRVMRPESE